MTILDWVLILLWSGLTLGGFWKGAVRIIFGGGGLLAGIWLAIVVGPDAQTWIEAALPVSWLAAVVARLLLVLVCVGICLAAGWGIEHTLSALHLSWLNRLFGAGLACVVATVLLGLLVVVAVRFSPELADLCRRSTVAQYLLVLSEWLLGAVEAAT